MSKKELAEAAGQALTQVQGAMVEGMKEAIKDNVGKDPMSKLKSLADEFTQVDVKIMRWDEKNRQESLFTTVPGMLLSDMASLDPHTICKREGGGGVWKVIYGAPDGKGRTVQVQNIRTEGVHHVLATHEAEKLGLDPRTGNPKGTGGLPVANMTPFIAQQDQTDKILKTIQETTTQVRAAEQNSMAQVLAATKSSNDMIVAALLNMNQQHAQQAQPAQNEELRILREEIKRLHETMAKNEADTRMLALQQEIKHLHDKLTESTKSSELKLLEAKLAEVAKPPAVDPVVALMTTMLGATREDSKANTALMLELFGKIAEKPDSTDRFAKVQNMLMESAMSNFRMMEQLARAQGGPASPVVEITRTIAEVAANFFGSRGEPEEEEVEETTEEPQALAGVDARQLPAPAKPEEPEEPKETEEPSEEAEQEGGEPMEFDPEKIRADFQAQIEKWNAGEALPEKDEEGNSILLTEKELDRAMAASSIDSAIRLLASRKAQPQEITARIFALAEDDHPIATHWLTFPLTATYQILRHWDKKNGQTIAQKRIADLTVDIMLHWVWVNEGNDPYGRSNYRPPRAVAGVEARTHGVATQGKQVKTAFGVKQENGDEGKE